MNKALGSIILITLLVAAGSVYTMRDLIARTAESLRKTDRAANIGLAANEKLYLVREIEKGRVYWIESRLAHSSYHPETLDDGLAEIAKNYRILETTAIHDGGTTIALFVKVITPVRSGGFTFGKEP